MTTLSGRQLSHDLIADFRIEESDSGLSGLIKLSQTIENAAYENDYIERLVGDQQGSGGLLGEGDALQSLPCQNGYNGDAYPVAYCPGDDGAELAGEPLHEEADVDKTLVVLSIAESKEDENDLGHRNVFLNADNGGTESTQDNVDEDYDNVENQSK